MSEAMQLGPEISVVKLACFEVDRVLYAIEVEYVREIVRMTEMTPLPNAPELIEGVVDLRGGLIPVVDLARVLGRRRAKADAQSRIAVLEFNGMAIGLWIDDATDVLTVDASALEDVPELATQTGYDAICSVIRRDHESPVMILSLDALVEAIYKSARPASALGESA